MLFLISFVGGSFLGFLSVCFLTEKHLRRQNEILRSEVRDLNLQLDFVRDVLRRDMDRAIAQFEFERDCG